VLGFAYYWMYRVPHLTCAWSSCGLFLKLIFSTWIESILRTRKVFFSRRLGSLFHLAFYVKFGLCIHGYGVPNVDWSCMLFMGFIINLWNGSLCAHARCPTWAIFGDALSFIKKFILGRSSYYS
jgi:hypothetical protein